MEIVKTGLWIVATIMLFVSGLYFSFKLNFIQFHVKDIFRSLKDKNNKGGITSFESLNIALASRIGVGSLAGVSLSIYLGGVGTIFWMWISAILCSANAFVESLLGVIYRENLKDNLYIGGPAYYIKKGMKKKLLASFYALIIMCAYVGGFLTIQCNTIVKSITEVFNINVFIIAVIVALISLFIVSNGIKIIAIVTSKLVLIMTIVYIFGSLIIVFTHFDKIIDIILLIIKSAFNFKSISWGFIPTFLIGMQRGIFSNEAGIGSGAIAAATADTNDPVKQGFVQMLGVYITTLVICTLTAFVVITAHGDTVSLINVNGIEITQHAFNYHLGNLGSYIIMISIILFAFSTIITGYFYGENNFKFIFKERHILKFRIIVFILIILGGIIPPFYIWSYIDLLIVLMAIINVYALLSLRKIVINTYYFYINKKMI